MNRSSLSAVIFRSNSLLFPDGEIILANSVRVVSESAVSIVAKKRVSKKFVSSDSEFVRSTVIGDDFVGDFDPVSDGGHGIIVRHGQADAFVRAEQVVAALFFWVAAVDFSRALVDINTNAVSTMLVSSDTGADVASLSVVAIFERAAWAGSALVNIDTVAIVVSFIAAVADWQADRANSLSSRSAWWIDSKGDASALGSSTVWVVDDGAMRMFALTRLLRGRHPSAAGFAVAVEGRATHSRRTAELVSRKVGERIATNGVRGGPFNFDFEASHPDPNSFFSLSRGIANKFGFAAAVIWFD